MLITSDCGVEHLIYALATSMCLLVNGFDYTWFLNYCLRHFILASSYLT
jgi:hypothetical protein